MRIVARAVICGLLFSCNGTRKATQHDTGPTQHDAGPTQHDTGPTQHDTGPTQHDAGPTASRPPPINLLRYGPAHVAVSSNVDNPRDFPEHLVDGNEDTAWNGRTGDLVGARISFAVPQTASVTSLILSAGFNKVTATGEDLFAMNHRVKKVSIRTIDDRALATWDLDPQQRAPQEFGIAMPGGSYELRVEEVVAGTKKEWHELTISEFAVMGIPAGAPFARPHVPNVKIGRLSQHEDPLSDGRKFPLPYGQYAASDKAMCVLFDKTAERALGPEATPLSFAPPPWCRLGARFRAPIPSVLSGKYLKGIYAIDLASETGSEEGFALHTEKGWAVPAAGIWNSVPCPKGCMDDMGRTRISLERVEGEGASVSLFVKKETSNFDGIPFVDTSWYSLRCALDSTPLVCTRVEHKASCSSRGVAVPCP